ncbi:acetyl-coenzyme A synthetase N-terminal domain-containing protein [Sphingomonas bacterium]|uniref:acetyl-coenzyme A synthetase N-terminal domain-containing protein n=1 Tax=Sphingomonas bacterium TaxID=1895847 RepID=UPI0034A0A7D0
MSVADLTTNPSSRAALHARSLADPDGFWLEQAQRLEWITAPTEAGDWSFAETISTCAGSTMACSMSR